MKLLSAALFLSLSALAQTPPPQTIVTVGANGAPMLPNEYIDDAGWIWGVKPDGTLGGPDCSSGIVGGECWFTTADCTGTCYIRAPFPAPRELFCVSGFTNWFARPSDTAMPHSDSLLAGSRMTLGLYCQLGQGWIITDYFMVDELQVVTAQPPPYTWPVPTQPYHRERR